MRSSLPRLRWLILILLSLSTVINYIDRQALAVLLPTLRRSLGLNGSAYGAIATVFFLAYTIGQLVWGVAVDYVGPRKSMLISVFVWSAAALAHAICTGPLGFGVCRGLLALGEAGNWPAGGKAVADWFPLNRRAFAMGFFDGGSGLGAILAPPLIAFLTLRFGWRAAFLATGALGLIWLAVWAATYRDPVAIAEPVKNDSLIRHFRRLIAERALWGLVATRFLATPVWYFYVFWLPDYFTRVRHFTLAEIGLFGWIPYVTVDLGKLIGGAASDQGISAGWPALAARKAVMAAGALAMMGGLRVIGAASAAESIGWISLATFGFGLWSANILALHADLFPPSQIGNALGLTGMAASLGGAASAYAIGRVVDVGGYQPVFYVAGLAAVIGFGVLCVSIPAGTEVESISPKIS